MDWLPRHGGPLWVLALVFVHPTNGWALSPEKSLTQYQQDVWSERDGLPQGSIQCVTQTRDGYLWLGTRDGLARFDGVSFAVFRTDSHPELGANDIRALHEDASGALWAGTFNGGVSRSKEGVFELFTKNDGLPHDGVLTILETSRGALWVGAWTGIARFDGARFTACDSDDRLAQASVWALAEDSQGRIWVGTDEGLGRFTGDAFEWVRLPVLGDRPSVRALLIDHENLLWIGTVSHGLVRWDGERAVRFACEDGLPADRISSLLQDRSGNLWIGTWKGVSRYSDDRMESDRNGGLLPRSLVESLCEDREGNLWLGTRGAGLTRLRDGHFSVLTAREGLAGNVTKTVFESSDGILWIGSIGAGLSAWKDGECVAYTTEDGLPSNVVRAIGEDSHGRLWVGAGRPAAVAVFRDGRFETFDSVEFPIQDDVRAVCGDREGGLWVGGDGGGLCRIFEGRVTRYTKDDGLPSELIRTIFQDSRGAIWAGSDGGLCRVVEGRIDVFTPADGLSHEAVYSITEDSEGILWFGTQRGVSRWSNGRFFAYTRPDGLPQDLIFQVLDDSLGTLWMSSNRGVFCIPKQAFTDYDAGRLQQLPPTSFGVADGLKTSQCQGGSQPAGCVDREGRLWFATVHGAATIDPKRLNVNRTPPPVLIEKVWVRDQSIELRDGVKFDPEASQFRFAYTALSFAAPEKVYFKYKLEGFDRDWVGAGTRRVAYYTKLPPGRYRFRVIGCNNDGVWNERGASFAFVLSPHFYETWWFFALCAAAALLVAWDFHRRRMRQAQAEFSLILGERNRIARDLHDTLAQGFAGIAFQMEAVSARLKDAPGQAQQHLNVALSMVRHSLSEARRSIMNLRASALEQHDLADALRETAGQLAAGQEADLKFEVKGSRRPLPSAVEDHLLRVGQEAITNAFKHSEAAALQVQIEYSPESVRVRVADNGKGFDASQAFVNPARAQFGLLGMRERVRQMDGELTINSRPEQGAEIIVEAPLPRDPRTDE